MGIAEKHGILGKAIDIRGGFQVVAIGRKAISTSRIDYDQNNIRLARQSSKIGE